MITKSHGAMDHVVFKQINNSIINHEIVQYPFHQLVYYNHGSICR